MAFGFSVGDFFAVGQFAWSVYKASGKGVGGEFEEVSHEVISLHTAIKELQDEAENLDSIFNRTGAGKKKELAVLVQNCNGVLQQLYNVLIKYKSLGTSSKRTWDRLRWGTEQENLAGIREKLTNHTSSLTLFVTTLGAGSLGRIEKKLDQLIEDVRAGKREKSILTLVDNDDDEAEIQWDLWKREMVDEGFTKTELEGHKDWIKTRLMELSESGSLHEELLEKPGTRKSTMTSSSGEAASETSNISQFANQPKDAATLASSGAAQAAADHGHSDGTELEKRENVVTLPKYSKTPEGLRKSGEEGNSGKKPSRIPSSLGSDISHSTDDAFLPTDPISNSGMNITGISSIVDSRKSHLIPPMAGQSLQSKDRAGEGPSNLRRSSSTRVPSPRPAQGTPRALPLTFHVFDDMPPPSRSIRETCDTTQATLPIYTPSLPTPPPAISENNIIEKHLSLTLEELFKGTQKKIKAKSRRNLRETVCEMDVKPGLVKGTVFKFKILGALDDGRQQDLHYIIEEKKHPCFTREGDNLLFELELTLLESLCGWKRAVRTIDGNQIPIEKAGLTQPGSSDTFSRLGMPLLNAPDQRGNFIVKYAVKYPASLSHAQKTKLRQALKSSS